MNTFFKILIGIVVVAILGVWVYLQSHQPMLKGKMKMEGLSAKVEVYYDTYGIPHIYADNADDAYRALGYTHAQDRLFQMELMRRAGAGRLSEVLGKELLDADMFFRTLGTNRKAKRDAAMFDSLPDNAKRACIAYLAGVNSYIQKGKTPLEFTVIGIEKEAFTIEDMYCISGYMAYSFAIALRTDPLVEMLQKKLGGRYMYDFDLGYAADTLVLPDTLLVEEGTMADLSAPRILDEMPLPAFQGSNNWVLGPSRTLSGKVMFANDTHIKYASPSVWYEAHIEYPGFGFYGNFLAGIPVALIGHTRNHTWGITMFEDDDSDFFYESFLDSDSTYTIYNDSSKAAVEKIKETIAIAGIGDTSITVYKTVHGVIINNFLSTKSTKPVSMYWNYTAIENNLIGAFYKMNHSTDIDAFREGVKLVGSPGLNIAYGDASGNIALWAAGKLIKRPEDEQGKTFLDGSKSEKNYQGFYPFDANPQSENPEKGYLFSANQQHDSTLAGLFPGYYVPETRYDRISYLLDRMYPATVDSMRAVSLDVLSSTEAAVSQEIARRIESSDQVLSDLEESALELMAGWDGNHRLRDTEPTVYYKVLYYILQKAMEDEMGKQNFNDYLSTHLFKRSYPNLISNAQSPWWDDVRTEDKKEVRLEIFVEAFKKSILELEEELGEDVQEWQWEKVHTTSHSHPLGKVDVMKPWFDVGPFPSPGGNETINNAGFTLNGDGQYIATYGPAMRIILDFADVENAISILPTGNSGNVMSPHYKDQAEMYIKGEFRKMMMNEKEIKANSTRVLINPENMEVEEESAGSGH